MRSLSQHLRSLLRDRLFTAAAVVSLALGIGSATAIFTVVNALLLRPLPYRNPERLVAVGEVITELRHEYPILPANSRHFLAWKQECRSCEDLVVMQPMTLVLSGSGEPAQVAAGRVSANFLQFLGVRPSHGRDFRADEDRAGNERVVIVSNAFWRERLGGDPGAIGRSILLNGRPHEVVGVLPPEFTLPGGEQLSPLVKFGDRVDVLRPMAFSDYERNEATDFGCATLARLRPGVTVAQAAAELDALQRELGRTFPMPVTLGISVRPLQQQIVGDTRRALMVLFAATGFVLLIVCVNVANLLLARNARRLRDVALRLAVGAGRGQVVRDALVESLLIAGAGGLLGTLLASWGVSALVRLAPSDLPRQAEIAIEPRVLAFTILTSALAAFLFGTIPSIRAARTDPADTLKRSGHTGTEAPGGVRLRGLLVGAQVALCALLLAAGGLVLRSYARLSAIDKGYTTDGVLTMEISLPPSIYGAQKRRNQAVDAILEGTRSIPGVRGSAIASAFPLTGETNVSLVSLEHDPRPPTQRPVANYRYVSPGYFDVMRIPLLAGRTFAPTDRGRQVVILSARTAQMLWPDRSPLGKRIHPGDFDEPLAEVVGIAADVRAIDLQNGRELMAYQPYWERGETTVGLAVATSGDPQSLAASVRARVHAVVADAPVSKVRTMSQVVSASLAERRFQLTLLLIFGATAFAIAAVGVYGVVAYAVTRRARELSIRIALGAGAGDVYRLVLRGGFSPAAVGLAAGLVASVGINRLLGGLLFEIGPADPLTLASVGVALGLAALVACLVPARRAARLDPIRTLRHE